jgi:NADH-quinone oxidoreductase subunit G
MPTFKLNDQEIPFEPGETIIRAAWKQGIEIPHYCWHPGLSVAANCRMCLVEVKSQRPMMLPILKWDAAKNDYVEATKPKLTPACQQTAAEGMEVSSESDEVKQAQAAVQEFLLLNHPVDCPICDQAGECKLQDYWLAHQAKLKRKESEPVHKVKGVRFGPTIVYDGERCVMCTRCIRFNDEVVGDPVLDMRERGNVNEIVLAPGRQLDHKYSLMNEHVCPVGALTSRDFRFKARVWFLKAAPSVCDGCATGCSDHIDFDPRDQQAKRIRPRDNEAVNKFWLCDEGMLSYHRFHENRQVEAVARDPRGDLMKTTPEKAIARAAALLTEGKASGAKVGVVLSAIHSSEDNFVLAKLAKDVLGASALYLSARSNGDSDNLLRNADKNPNRAGALSAAGATELPGLDALVKDIASGAIDTVLTLGWIFDSTLDEDAAIAKAKTIIALATHTDSIPPRIDALVPVAIHAEMNGTFVNAKGMAQQFKRAVHAPDGVRPAWEVCLELASLMKANLGVQKFEDVRKAALPANVASQSSSEARA